MKDLGYLANRMKQLREAVPKAANKLAIDVAKIIQTDLVYVTPVDTSDALSNWVLTVGEQWAVWIQGGYYTGEQGSTQEASARAALQQGERQLATKQPGMPIFITNNAPHIKLLNDGSSRQAPAGFVERSALLGRNRIENVGIKLKVNGVYV